MKKTLRILIIFLLVFSIVAGIKGKMRIQTVIINTIEELNDVVREEEEKDNRQDVQISYLHTPPYSISNS